MKTLSELRKELFANGTISKDEVEKLRNAILYLTWATTL